VRAVRSDSHDAAGDSNPAGEKQDSRDGAERASAQDSSGDREIDRLREALLVAQREIQSLRERIRIDASERDELLTVVSHELRTPVTVIAGYNKLLLSRQVGGLNAEQTRFLEESTKSCRRLSAFIGKLVDVSGLVRGETALTRGDVELAPLIGGVVAFLRPLLERAEQHVEVCLADDAQCAYCDAGRIEQVITNLLNNAMKHARAGKSIRVSSRAVDRDGAGAVEIRVEDEGPGVAPVDRERIFDPYVRLSRHDVSGGLGLGLAICRRIVKAHGGEIAVTEREGGGSLFVFDLPARPVSDAREGS
jgi:signal transduction histidine kinase